MLTYEDNATIRHAIMRRLDKETGVNVADLKIEKKSDCIAVGVWSLILDVCNDVIDVRSFFDLPLEFEHKHLLNEIDEMCEQIKEAKRKAGPFAVFNPNWIGKREQLKGTGLRGRWKQHAE